MLLIDTASSMCQGYPYCCVRNNLLCTDVFVSQNFSNTSLRQPPWSILMVKFSMVSSLLCIINPRQQIVCFGVIFVGQSCNSSIYVFFDQFVLHICYFGQLILILWVLRHRPFFCFCNLLHFLSPRIGS